jgi:hypothetical protein
MNWADLTSVITPLICTFAAGAGAAQEKMGWGSLVFAAGGFAIGLGCGLVTRRLGILLLFVGCKQSRSLLTFGLLLAYMLIPMALMFGAVAGTAWLSAWLARCFV